MDNMKLNKDMINNLKNVFGDEKVSSALSSISPEIINNFSKSIGQNKLTKKSKDKTKNDMNYKSKSSTDNSNPFENINNLDIATLMKIKNIFNKINSNNNDPRANLLMSLKPYLRDTRKETIDTYLNVLKFSDFANIINQAESEDRDND